MQQTISPDEDVEAIEASSAHRFTKRVLELKVAPREYVKVVGYSTKIEGVYAARLYVAAGVMGVISIPLAARFYGLTRDAAIATALVPMLLGYVALRLLVDLMPAPERAPVSYRGWLVAPIGCLVLGAVGFFFLAFGIAVSAPIYRIVHVTWVTTGEVILAAVITFVLSVVLATIAGGSLEIVMRYCRRTGREDVPTLFELFMNVLRRLERDMRHPRLVSHWH
jgi:hypothetical protein